MDKSIAIKFLIISVVVLLACKTSEEFSHTVRINSIKNDSMIIIPLNKQFARQKIVMIENSANDTFSIGIMKVAPGVVGKLYDIEFYNEIDTLSYTIKPFKATQGKIYFKHIFYD